MDERRAYDNRIKEKADAPFARKFRSLVPDADGVKKLSNYLGCSVQAINQYKQGTAFPKTENLIKMADYFDCSVDYLLGRSNAQSRDEDIQVAQVTTGLSEESVTMLSEYSSSNDGMIFVHMLDSILSAEDGFRDFALSLFSVRNMSVYMDDLCDSVENGVWTETDEFDHCSNPFYHAYEKLMVARFNLSESLDDLVEAICDYKKTNKRCKRAYEKLLKIDRTRLEGK